MTGTKKPLPFRKPKNPKGKGKQVALKIDDVLAEFKSRFTEICGRIEEAGLSAASLSEFERSLFRSLGELGRSLETSVLESSDVDQPYIDIDGKRQYRKYCGPEEYQSFLGKIIVRRTVYQANGPGTRTVCPLERNAGIVHRNLTPLAAEFVSYATALSVPTEVEQFCRQWHFLQPSSTVIKHVASEVGELAETLAPVYHHEIHEREEPDPTTDCVVVSRDGTMVNVRKEGWKQVEVGTVSLYSKGERLSTKYVATMPGSVESLSEKLDREIEATLDKLPASIELVYVADGALSNWKYQEEHPVLKEATGILDFWHGVQKVGEAASALFGEGTDAAKKWLKEQKRKLLEDDRGVERVLQSLRNQRTRQRIRSNRKLETLRDVERYLDRNRDRMRYTEYRDRELPIGSGVVEAACKVVVGQRLKRSGMRWSREGGQRILKLRTLVMSRRWNEFWKAHEALLDVRRVA